MKTNTIKYSQTVWKSTIIMVLDLNERKAPDQNPEDPSLISGYYILSNFISQSICASMLQKARKSCCRHNMVKKT